MTQKFKPPRGFVDVSRGETGKDHVKAFEYEGHPMSMHIVLDPDDSVKYVAILGDCAEPGKESPPDRLIVHPVIRDKVNQLMKEICAEWGKDINITHNSKGYAPILMIPVDNKLPIDQILQAMGTYADLPHINFHEHIRAAIEPKKWQDRPPSSRDSGITGPG